MAKTWNKSTIELADYIGIDCVIADNRAIRYERHKEDEPEGGKRSHKMANRQTRRNNKVQNYATGWDLDAIEKHGIDLVVAKLSEYYTDIKATVKNLNIFEDEAYLTFEVTATNNEGIEEEFEENEFLNDMELIDLGFVC